MPPPSATALHCRRYKLSLIDSEAYLMACMRYIELNSVRAGICIDQAHYRWSGYRSNASGEAVDTIIAYPLFAGLGQDATRQAAYRDSSIKCCQTKPLAISV